MKRETEVLDLTVSEEGIKGKNDKIKIVQEWPQPKTIPGLRSFVGLLQYFRRLIKRISRNYIP